MKIISSILMVAFFYSWSAKAETCDAAKEYYASILDRLQNAVQQMNWTPPGEIELSVSCKKNDLQLYIGFLGILQLPANFILFAQHEDSLAGVFAHELTHFYTYSTLHPSWSAEFKADESSTLLLSHAGYSPNGIIEGLEDYCAYAAQAGRPDGCQESRSHPSYEERKKRLIAFIEKMGEIREPQTSIPEEVKNQVEAELISPPRQAQETGK